MSYVIENLFYHVFCISTVRNRYIQKNLKKIRNGFHEESVELEQEHDEKLRELSRMERDMELYAGVYKKYKEIASLRAKRRGNVNELRSITKKIEDDKEVIEGLEGMLMEDGADAKGIRSQIKTLEHEVQKGEARVKNNPFLPKMRRLLGSERVDATMCLRLLNFIDEHGTSSQKIAMMKLKNMFQRKKTLETSIFEINNKSLAVSENLDSISKMMREKKFSEAWDKYAFQSDRFARDMDVRKAAESIEMGEVALADMADTYTSLSTSRENRQIGDIDISKELEEYLNGPDEVGAKVVAPMPLAPRPQLTLGEEVDYEGDSTEEDYEDDRDASSATAKEEESLMSLGKKSSSNENRTHKHNSQHRKVALMAE